MRKLFITLLTIFVIGISTTAWANMDTLLSWKEEREIADQFQKLTRSNVWEEKEKIDLQFDSYHPQGMTKVGDLFYMSSVEIIEKPVKYDHPKDGYDRTAGKGVGHLFVFNENGKLLKDITLGEGDMYHPGGIAFDGESIWVPVAEYRPDSESVVYKINPDTLDAKKVFHADDHIGGILHEEKKNSLKAVTWGSRMFYEFSEEGKVIQKKENPSHFVDYQDCESAGDEYMVCSGITELPQPGDSSSKYELGGLALLDINTMEMKHEIPISLFSEDGHVLTRNPVFLESTKNGIKMYSVPDDDQSSMLIHETTTNEE